MTREYSQYLRLVLDSTLTAAARRNLETIDALAGALGYSPNGLVIPRASIEVGTADHVVINAADGSLSSEAQLAVTRGGTGAADAAGARTALGLVIDTDVQAYSAKLAALAALADGTSGQALTTNGAGAYAWASVLTDPMSARGDLLRRDSSNVTNRLAIGSAGTVLKSDGSDPSWGAVVNADISASAAIALSKLAALTASRAMVTDGSGFASASSVTATELGYLSGLTSSAQTQLDARLSKAGGTMTGDLTLAQDPSSSLHAATKQYVDAAINGVYVKPGVRVATTGNITLSGTQTIDGVAVTAGQRVLVKNQSSAQNNGIYVCAAGAWSRAADADTYTELLSALVTVAEGTANANTGWYQTSELTSLSDSQTWSQFFGAGTYAADGNGIELSGSTFSLELDGSTLSKSASGLKVAAGGIGDTQIASGVARSKLAAGTASHVVINDGSGALSSEAQLAISRGGTGQATAAAAFKALAAYSAKGDLVAYDGSTASRLGIGTDGQTLQADSTATYGFKWGDAGNGAGEINVISNPSAASATTGTTAGTSHSVVRDTSNSPLNGVISTCFAISATANAAESSTSGVYWSPSMPSGLRNKKLKVDIYFTTPASDTWAISVYSGSTRVALSTDSSGATNLPASTTGKFTVYLDADSSSSYTVHLTRTAGTGTTTMYVTNVVMGPGIQPQGAVVGEWQSFTPSWSASAPAMSANTGRWRRVGDSMQVVIDFTASGAGTGTAVLLTIPNSLTINTTLSPASNTSSLGNAALFDTGVTVKGLYVGSSTSTQVAFIKTGETLDSIDGDEFSNGDQFGANFTVPIAEWAGAGTVNIAQNDVEYAYNSSNSDGADTTSFAYGPGGVAVFGTLTAAQSKRVRFLTPILPTDRVEVLIDIRGDGRYVPAGSDQVSTYHSQNTTSYGVGIKTVTGSTTDVDVVFGQYRIPTGATFGAAGANWTSTFRWVARKTAGGQAVGFGLVVPGTSSGLVSKNGLAGKTDGVALGSGYVGERLTSSGSATAWTSGQYMDGGNAGLPLTAGVWLIKSTHDYAVSSDSAITEFKFGVGTASGNSATGLTNYEDRRPASHTPSGNARYESPYTYVNISATTTYYPKFLITGTRSGGTVSSGLEAVRIA